MSENAIWKMTEEQYKKYLNEHYYLAKCRLCGEEMLCPKQTYTPSDLIGYECPTCIRKLRTLGRII